MILIEKTLDLGHNTIFKNRGTGNIYRRVVGGLAWPCPPKPGFLVVIAEDVLPDDAMKARCLWVMAEREGASIYDLHRFCRELRYQCQADKWVGDTTRNPEMRQFNHQDRDFKNRVSLRSAPFADSSPKVAAYAQMISERTQANRKILYFFEGSKLPGYLLGHTAEETDKPAANYPPLAALGYAVAELIFKEPMDLRIFNQKPITDWDPLNH